jgi:hypothetical protein
MYQNIERPDLDKNELFCRPADGEISNINFAYP